MPYDRVIRQDYCLHFLFISQYYRLPLAVEHYGSNKQYGLEITVSYTGAMPFPIENRRICAKVLGWEKQSNDLSGRDYRSTENISINIKALLGSDPLLRKGRWFMYWG